MRESLKKKQKKKVQHIVQIQNLFSVGKNCQIAECVVRKLRCCIIKQTTRKVLNAISFFFSHSLPANTQIYLTGGIDGIDTFAKCVFKKQVNCCGDLLFFKWCSTLTINLNFMFIVCVALNILITWTKLFGHEVFLCVEIEEVSKQNSLWFKEIFSHNTRWCCNRHVFFSF